MDLTPEQKQARLVELHTELAGLQPTHRPLLPAQNKRRMEVFAEIHRLEHPAPPPIDRTPRVLDLVALLRELRELALDPAHVEFRRELAETIVLLMVAPEWRHPMPDALTESDPDRPGQQRNIRRDHQGNRI